MVLVLLVKGRAFGINSAGVTESRAPSSMVLINTALRRIGRCITSSIIEFCFVVYLSSWDISLTLINALTFNRKVGRVTLKGHAGEGGIWPEYIPPQPGDIRCSCPALNAMANHGSSPFVQAKVRLSLTCSKVSSHETDATSPFEICLERSARLITFLLRSASTCHATSRTS